MKFNKINVLGWVSILMLSISGLFFKEELSIIMTGFGGLICLLIGLTLTFYKGKKGSEKH
ncbi:hypothetical protein ABES03_20785 [Neobacillus rhizosphaerae]|uniref:hypothetical protein n=1 Tax=Neobacillus rhizosphaerae TaxID=2880965 RepID=UPI003D26D6EE